MVTGPVAQPAALRAKGKFHFTNQWVYASCRAPFASTGATLSSCRRSSASDAPATS